MRDTIHIHCVHLWNCQNYFKIPTKKEKNPQPNAVQQKGGVGFSDWSVNVPSERSCSHAVGDGCL